MSPANRPPNFSLSGRHEIYCCASRICITEQGVKVETEPLVKYCPLHEAMYGTRKIDERTLRKSMEMKISGMGFYCRNRAFEAQPVVAYGASEVMLV